MTLNKILHSVRENSGFLEQLSSLKALGKASFPGMVGSSASVILSSLLDDFNNILIITSSTERANIFKSEIELFSGKQVILFPAPDTVPGEEMEPSKELIGERLAVLEQWNNINSGIVVVAPVKAVMWKTSLRLENIRVSANQKIRIDVLIEMLINFGYRRFDIVGGRGEISVRGGIVDIFPLNFEHPVRIEFFGDEVESIRFFDAYSQRSINKIREISILPAHELFEVPVLECLKPDTVVVFDELLDIERSADRQLDEQASFPTPLKYLSFNEIITLANKFKTIGLSSFIKPGEDTIFASPGNYPNKPAEIPKASLVISKHAARLRDAVQAEVVEGNLCGGFVINDVEVITDKEIFGERFGSQRLKPPAAEGVADELLADLKIGDYVVHETYGIGLYQGLEMLEIGSVEQEYILVEFADGDKVYVPPSMAGLVEKYSSGGDFHPRLSRLGTKKWLRTRSRVKKELKDMTKDLLELYAAREKLPGFAYPADDLWQAELEGTFPYQETPDQQKAILETKHDMQSSRPMDRLVCGDVGYGKTEVAIRAAAKAVSSGKQVAVLVPTTILAEQHYNNFKERFRSSPFVIEMLSRFRSKLDQSGVVKSLASGGIDIVIGTHRLLQKDIVFRDLGLLIIDEEQRFGVGHKEKLKKIRKAVDVLTLSATPIPRTLYLSLSGARDLSMIRTAPVDRSPIRTYVLPWSEAVIREAVLREMDRGGQVYFVHNFVETIEGMAAKIKRLVPDARVTVGHGQMREKELEKTMVDFLDRKYDVLVCTSIIESGLDIPSVNTILIDSADRFGLSQLYQIRGRVGRSAVRAYAYMFYHPDKLMRDQALERLKAIQEFTALGSGYKLAMRDLEIRGSGNLLGAQQSGHIMEVGFDLYCELLEEAVREIKGVPEASPREVEIDLRIEAFIPEDYVSDDRQRIALYRRMNLIGKNIQIGEMRKELRDRFGKIPGKLEKLFDILGLKVKALQAGVKSIKEENSKIVIDWISGKRKSLEVLEKDRIKLAEQAMRH